MKNRTLAISNVNELKNIFYLKSQHISESQTHCKNCQKVQQGKLLILWIFNNIIDITKGKMKYFIKPTEKHQESRKKIKKKKANKQIKNTG